MLEFAPRAPQIPIAGYRGEALLGTPVDSGRVVGRYEEGVNQVSIRIVAISDTHLYRWDEVHPDIRAAVREADIAVHCGDIVRQDLVDGMRREASRAVIVHGNSDPPDLRSSLPYTEVIETEGLRVGVTHPAWGGPEFPLEDLLPDFHEPVDAILFGHFHETVNEVRDGVLFLNPGQAYKSFMVPATIAVLTIECGRMFPEIIVVEK